MSRWDLCGESAGWWRVVPNNVTWSIELPQNWPVERRSGWVAVTGCSISTPLFLIRASGGSACSYSRTGTKRNRSWTGGAEWGLHVPVSFYGSWGTLHRAEQCQGRGPERRISKSIKPWVVGEGKQVIPVPCLSLYKGHQIKLTQSSFRQTQASWHRAP